MISAYDIKQFLNRPVTNHTWVKELSESDLDKAIAELNPKPQLHAALRMHQKACFLLAVAYPQFYQMLDLGCVDCDTEYLSPDGWRRIDSYVGGKVAQYNCVDKTADFVEPLAYIKLPCDSMYRLHTKYGIDQKLSFDHKVLYTNHYNDIPQTILAEDLYNNYNRLAIGWRGRFYTSFKIRNNAALDISNAALRVQVAVIADGSFNKHLSTNRCTIRIKKDRKKKRLRQLLQDADISWKEYSDHTYEPNFTRFIFYAPRKDKEFNEWYWGASYNQLCLIAEECVFWDGSINESKKRVGFYSRSKKSADFIQFAFAATQQTAHLHSHIRSNNKIDYSVSSNKKPRLISLRGTTSSGDKIQNIFIEPVVDGYKYCFSVISGFLVLRRNGCIFITGNCGKTLTTLELLRYFYQTGKLRKWTLILCPMDELVDSWEDEIRRWNITIPYVSLRGSSAQKWQTLRGFECGLVLGTYVGVSAMCCEMRAAPTKQNQKRRKHTPIPEYVEALVKQIDGFVADQSTRIGNVESLSYKVMRNLAKLAKVRYNLAGRPFARDPLLLWSQFYVMDRGQTLTPNYSFFREVFFDKKKAWFGGPNTYEYKFKRELHPQLSRLLCNRSISYARSECLDLPPRTYMKRIVQQPKDVSLQYRKVVNEALSHRGSFTEMQNAFVRMRQICSGFVALKEDAGDESKAARIQLAFKDNPKLDSLLELLDEMPDDSKAIVFYEFTYSAKLIGEVLKKKKISFGWLWAGTKNWPEIKRQFDTDPEFRILLNQHKKGGMGLNLQAADYTIFYESPVSVLERDEAEGRNYRQGQTKPVMVYDIIMKDSIDEQILAYHKEGNSLFKALVADPNKVLKKKA